MRTEADLSKAEMAREAFRALGTHATHKEAEAFVHKRYGVEKVLQSVTSMARKKVAQELTYPNGVSKKHIPNVREAVVDFHTEEEVVETTYTPSPRSEKPGRWVDNSVTIDPSRLNRDVVKAVRLTREAIEAAGGKEQLKELIDLL